MGEESNGKKTIKEVTIRSSAAEYLTFVAATNIINLRIKNCFFDLQSTYLLS